MRPEGADIEALSVFDETCTSWDALYYGKGPAGGIMDHIEDRVVGLKVRDVYEVPAATVILEAHKELEKLVCTGRQNALKPNLDLLWAQLAYEGLWYEPLSRYAAAWMLYCLNGCGTASLPACRLNFRMISMRS